MFKMLILILLACSSAFAEGRGDIFIESVWNLRPTQAYVGMKQIEERTEKIADMSKKKRHKYLYKRTVPVVIGPDNEYYMIDRHHLAVALIKADHKKLYVEILHDWSDLSESAFWKRMKEKKLTYLKRPDGSEMSYRDLPYDVSELKDNPYRSLAYFAREKGAFQNTSTPYSEFYWAEYFAKHITLREIRQSWSKAINKAFHLAKSPAARHLPGYKGSRAQSCSKIF